MLSVLASTLETVAAQVDGTISSRRGPYSDSGRWEGVVNSALVEPVVRVSDVAVDPVWAPISARVA